MSKSDRQLLTIGVFFIIIVVGILLASCRNHQLGLICSSGCWCFAAVWVMALGGMRAGKPQKYERGTFSTMASGLGLIALGAAWYLFGINWLYSLVVILLVVAALAIAAALRRK